MITTCSSNLGDMSLGNMIHKSSKVVMIFVSNQEDMVISHHSFLSSCLISQLSLTQLK